MTRGSRLTRSGSPSATTRPASSTTSRSHRLKTVLDGLHAKADLRFLPDRTHFDLYAIGKDRQGLLNQFSWEMYALARPHSKLKPAAAAP